MNRHTRRFCLALVIALCGVTARAAGPDQPIGLSLDVETEGIFSVKVNKVLVTKLLPESQAAAAGIVVGDELIRVQGIPVPGNSPDVLAPHLSFTAGQSKLLVFRRPNGSVYEVTLKKAQNG